MLVGSQNGYLYFYNNITGNLGGNFTLADSTFQGIWEGTLTAPTGYDINSDGLMDLVVGNYAGGAGMFFGQISGSMIGEKAIQKMEFELFPNPAANRLTVKFGAAAYGRKTIGVSDLLGRELMNENMDGTGVSLDISGLPAGMYLCRVHDENGNNGVMRFVKGSEK
jgi:hypothetical protein